MTAPLKVGVGFMTIVFPLAVSLGVWALNARTMETTKSHYVAVEAYNTDRANDAQMVALKERTLKDSMDELKSSLTKISDGQERQRDKLNEIDRKVDFIRLTK